MGDYAQNRLESRLIQVINTLIVQGEIKNPKLSRFASISEVSLSKDNAYATAYVSCLEDNLLDNSVKALQSAAGFIQAKVGSVLKTKNTPRITFVADTTQRDAGRINELLKSIQ